MAAVVIFLDIYVMLLERKIRKIQDAMKNIAAASQNACKSNKDLAEITKTVNGQIINLMNVNKDLCTINRDLINVMKLNQTTEDGK